MNEVNVIHRQSCGLLFDTQKGSIKRKGREVNQKALNETKERLNNVATSHIGKFISLYGVRKAASNPAIVKEHLQVKYTIKTGKHTDQGYSGRCWIFAILNLLRINVIHEYGKDFKYSANYITFWDRYERANFFFEKMIEFSFEQAESPRVRSLLSSCLNEGGFFEYLVNIINKYGIVPEEAMKETENSFDSHEYQKIYLMRLREWGGILHKMAKEGKSYEEIELKMKKYLFQVREMLERNLGIPPKSFMWKNKKDLYKEITPKKFYSMNGWDLMDFVSLTNLPNYPMKVVLEAQDRGNCIEGIPIRGINVSMKVIKRIIRKSIKDGIPVIFTSELRNLDKKKNVLTMDSDLTDEIYGFDGSVRLSKGERLRYSVTNLEHDMLIVGCDSKKQRKCSKEVTNIPEAYGPLWKAENSWGKRHHFFYMGDKWFDEFCFAVVVYKKFLPKNVLELMENADENKIVVEPWSAFGALSRD